MARRKIFIRLMIENIENSIALKEAMRDFGGAQALREILRTVDIDEQFITERRVSFEKTIKELN